MKDKKKKKANFPRTFSIIILIFLLIKFVVKFIKEHMKKFNLSEKEDIIEDEEDEIFGDNNFNINE